MNDAPTQTPRRLCPLALTALGAGTSLALVGDAYSDTLFRLGLLLILLAATALLVKRSSAADELFEAGRHVGYRAGMAEGRRIARPVVVTARCPHCKERLNAVAS